MLLKFADKIIVPIGRALLLILVLLFAQTGCKTDKPAAGEVDILEVSPPEAAVDFCRIPNSPSGGAVKKGDDSNQVQVCPVYIVQAW